MKRKGMTAEKMIISGIIFLVVFGYLATLGGTAFITGVANYTYNSSYNGTVYNVGTYTQFSGGIPQQPVCSFGIIFIDGIAKCGSDYAVYLFNLLMFNTGITWLQGLIIGFVVLIIAIGVISFLKPDWL